MDKKYLSKADILGADDLEIKEVDVPEWDGVVRLKAFTGRERDEFEAAIADSAAKTLKERLSNIRAKVLANSIVNKDGKKLFSDKDVNALGGKDGKILDRLFEVAKELSGILSVEEDIEEAVKNLESGQNDDSTSDSQKS